MGEYVVAGLCFRSPDLRLPGAGRGFCVLCGLCASGRRSHAENGGTDGRGRRVLCTRLNNGSLSRGDTAVNSETRKLGCSAFGGADRRRVDDRARLCRLPVLFVYNGFDVDGHDVWARQEHHLLYQNRHEGRHCDEGSAPR